MSPAGTFQRGWLSMRMMMTMMISAVEPSLPSEAGSDVNEPIDLTVLFPSLLNHGEPGETGEEDDASSTTAVSSLFGFTQSLTKRRRFNEVTFLMKAHKNINKS